MLVLAGLSFALPFVTVSCDTPGGYGRAAPGATTTYTGFDLATGGSPDVAPIEKLRPRGEWRDDRLPPQPAADAVLLLIVAGTVLAVTISDRRARRATVAVLAGVAATVLLVNQALAEADIRVQVSEQLTRPIPAGKSIRDFVHTGLGFAVCLVLLLLVAAINAYGWWRARPQAALVAHPRPEAGPSGEPETTQPAF
jgi:hypothetical protein